jgi:hypothetical protein
MTTIIDEDQLSQFSRAADIAGHIVNEIPDIADDNDADLGVIALVMCGLLAGKLIANGLPRAEFMRQMDLAIEAKLRTDSTTKTPQ